MRIIMGTGSRQLIVRPNALEVYKNLEKYILEVAAQEETLLITGMAEGWDEALGLVGLRNNIPYTAAVPNAGYGQYYWGGHSLLRRNRMDRFNEILYGAQEIVYVCQSIYVNGVHANFIRNQYMVDCCTEAVVYDPTSSGTKDGVARLIKANKPYVTF